MVPSRTRFIVIYFAVTLAIITYVDRVCISQAAPQMQKDLGLTKEQMGWAFTAFSLAYALFEIPGGWLGDKIGPRKVLMRVVAMWSVFTVATGWAFNLAALEALNCCPRRRQVAPHRCGLPPFERMKYLALLAGWKWRKARRAFSAWLTR